MSIRVGSKVSWKWGSSQASGKVTEIHRDKVTRTTKGSEITRNGSDDDPASFAALRLLGFPERNRRGIAETLVRLKAAAEADARQAS